MPQIPTLQNQVRLDAAPNVQVRPLENTAAQSVGAGLLAVGNTIDQVRHEEHLKADRAAFMDADRHTDTVANDLLSQAQTLQGKDAIGSAPKLLEQFDKTATDTEAALKSQRARTAYRESVNARRAGLQRALDNHEGSQREAYYAKSREDFKDQAHINAVTAYQDPKAIEGEIAKISSAIDQTPGVDEAQKATELGVRRSSVYAGVVERYLSNDQVDQADKYYKSIKDKVNGPMAASIERGLLAAKQRLESEKNAKLTEARQAMSDQLRDIQAAAQLGIPVTQVPPRAVLEGLYGKHEGGQKYENAQAMADLSVKVSSMNHLPTDELVKQAHDFTPTKVEGAADQAQLAGFVANRTEAIINAREKDGAGYLVQYAPATQKAWQQFMGMAPGASPEERAAATEGYLRAVRADRERLQIPGKDVLPNSYAETVANTINSAPSAEQLATALEVEGNRWGKAWPQVYEQIAPKLSDTAAVIGSGIPRAAAVKLAATSQLKDTELKSLVPPGTKWKDVADAVDKRLDQFERSFPATGARTFNAFRESALRLSAQYMHEGASRSDAVTKAYQDLIGGQYQMIEYRGTPMRVPATMNGDDAERGAELALNRYSAGNLDVLVPGGSSTPAEVYQEQHTNYVHDNGYWITNPSGTGLALYVDGGPVTAGGVAVEKSWEQLRALTVADDQVTAGKARDESVQRQLAR
jgi:hypothetical protein